MAKLHVYEFVLASADGVQGRIHTVRSNNWRDAVKAIQRYAKDEVIAFQLADPRNYSVIGAKGEKDAVVEHPVAAVIRPLASEED